MDRATAAQLLGIEISATVLEISKAYASHHAELAQRERDAPTEALREKYRTALADLEVALTSLHPSPAADSYTPEQTRRSLSNTEISDLPLSGLTSQESYNNGDTTNTLSGSILQERFEIKEIVGRGGMGVVYRAFDRARGKEVALKQLHTVLLRDPSARERFLNEARLSCELTHPSIVRVFDVPLDGNNIFILMELLQGETLRTEMVRRRRIDKPYTLEEVKAILKPLCEALGYAHAQTVHRDVKPENIWIGRDGDVKLMDFGIAKVMSASQLTQTGTAMGTAYYMAPEQLKSASEVDGRADQYAVAVLAYELLSGDVPAGKVRALGKSAKGIPASFSTAIDKALSPDPEQRYPDMAAFCAALKVGKTERSSFVMPWRNIGIVSGLLLVLGIGGSLVGNVDFKKLLPQSAEEKQAQYNSAVQLEGEVNGLAERLRFRASAAEQQLKEIEQRKNGAEQSLRTAREGKAELLEAIDSIEQELVLAESGWKLRQRGVYESRKLTTLTGMLALGSRQVKDALYAEAGLTLEKAKSGYQELLTEDQAGEDIPPLWDEILAAKAFYNALKIDDEFIEPVVLNEARTKENDAHQAEGIGELVKARDLYREAVRGWLHGLSQAEVVVAQISEQRAKEAAEQERLSAEQHQLAEKAKARARAQANAKAKAEAQVEAERQAKLRAEQEDCGKNTACMLKEGEGVLRQVMTGLHWAKSASDNALNRDDARIWCSSKGRGWRLPSLEELSSIYDQSTKVSNRSCGYSCEVSPLFDLRRSYWFWTNDTSVFTEGWVLELDVYKKESRKVIHTAGALCVRGG